MGDKSPKSKNKDQKQKTATKKGQADRASAKQAEHGQQPPAKTGK
jgi:hypothetical protein